MKLRDVKPGMTVYPDADFTCVDADTPSVVKRESFIKRLWQWLRTGDMPHGLYIDCDCGEHGLDGQEREDGTLSGIAALPWVGINGRQNP